MNADYWQKRTALLRDGAERVGPGHVGEAIGYRTLDRKLWAR